MTNTNKLLEQNIAWADAHKNVDPEFFSNMAGGQAPKFLWIGCADSRVPATQVVGVEPGEMFVTRNIANVVAPDDTSCLSVIQYAVEALKVEHIIVCGHYGCGGVKAALDNAGFGVIDDWIEPIKQVRDDNAGEIDTLPEDEKFRRLCELNVAQQVANVCATETVQNAWNNNTALTVHGWIYNLEDGLLKDLGLSKGGAA